jgi:hypothetical protein
LCSLTTTTGAGSLAHGEIAFHDFHRIQQRRAGRGNADRGDLVHAQVALHGVGGRENGIVGRVSAHHNKIDALLGEGGRSGQRSAAGRHGHGIGIFAGSGFAALLNAGPLNYPLVGQAI